MCSMKPGQVAVLFFVVTVLLAGRPALAGESTTTTLSCVADQTDQDYGASGTASLSNIKYHYVWAGPFDYYSYYSGALTVTCQGLTPGATYWVGPPGDAFSAAFTASKSGTGGVKEWVAFYADLPVVVYREDTVDGTVQLVRVLEGWLVYP